VTKLIISYKCFTKQLHLKIKTFKNILKKYLEKREEKKKNKVDPPKEEPKKEPPKEDDGKKQAQKKKKVEDVKKEPVEEIKPKIEVKAVRPDSAIIKKPPKVVENAEEVQEPTQKQQPKGIISDKNDNEDEGERKNEEEDRNKVEAKNEDEGDRGETSGKVIFSTKLGQKKNGKKQITKTNFDIDSIKNYIQEISRNANPIGKIIDFLPDDIDSMNKELQNWIKEQKSLKDKYDEEIKKSDELLLPLNTELLEIEECIRDEIVKINSIKYRIIKNEQIIQNLISNVISVKKNE